MAVTSATSSTPVTTTAVTTPATTPTNVIAVLNPGTLDTKKLVSDLMTAARAPQQALIDKQKQKSDAAIASVAQLKNALAILQSSAENIASVSKLNQLQIANSNPAAIGATSGGVGVALPGTHTLSVTTLAEPTRLTTTSGYTDSSTVLSSNATTVSIAIGTSSANTIAIPAGYTLAQTAAAINAAGLGVSARLVNTGASSSAYQMVLEGTSGADYSFTASITDDVTSSSIESFGTTLQTAQDASFSIDGLAMTRSSNVITDALPGVTLKLNGTTTSATLGVSFDASSVATAVQNFVDAYNLTDQFVTKALGQPVAGDDIAGSLAGNSVVRTMRDSLRTLLTAVSSTPATDVTNWGDMGVSLDKTGVLQLDQSKFVSAFDSKPGQVIKALSANLAAPAQYTGDSSGLAGNLAVKLFSMTRSTGTLADLASSLQSGSKQVTAAQAKLDQNMAALQTRYDTQFNALNAVLDQFKTTQSSLTNLLNQNKSSGN